MSIAYIGIGSNLGDRGENVETAICRMRLEKELKVLRISSIYESDPLGVTDQPQFLNGVVEVETSLPPRDLLRRLLVLETHLGRKRSIQGGPRIMDLDLLLYDKVVMREGDLTLPHPEMHRRKFVLLPLLELVPEITHPQLKRPLKEFLRSLNRDRSHGRVEIYLH